MKNLSDQRKQAPQNTAVGSGGGETWEVISQGFCLQSPGRGKSIHFLQHLCVEHAGAEEQGS